MLEPRHALAPADLSALASEGVKVLRPLSRGRYLVRVADGSAIDETNLRVRSLHAIDPETKLQRSAERVLARSLGHAELNVFFHDDVTPDGARAAILDAGGTLAEPFVTDLLEPRRLRAYVTEESAFALAADDRVLMIRAPFRLRPEVHNATSAAVSNVTQLFVAPYDLTGNGVVLSYFELGTPSQHRDFTGRFTINWTCNALTDGDCTDGNRTHATHVAGTIIGAGVGSVQAKGMAPAARLFSFDAGRSIAAYMRDKEQSLQPLGVIADNNSWGYSMGWYRGGTTGWVWEDTEEYYGGYDGEVTAPLDKITRDTGVLFVHAAGNDGSKFGPTSAPFSHQHVDDELEPIPNRTFCYSASGSGTDCVSPCTDCEITRHPVNGSGQSAITSFFSIGVTAAAKNIITVGATNAARAIGNYSSRGPAADGRIKPELVARGGTDASPVFSTSLNEGYVSTSGTSMASPVVTGIVALMTEQWKRIASTNPSPTMLKTVLIAAADDVGNAGPDYTYGYGFVNAKAAVDLLRADNNGGSRIRSGGITHGQRLEIPLALNANQNLRVVVSWPDPDVLLFDELDLAAVALVNDLDLKLVDANGAEVLPFVLDPVNPQAVATRGVNTVDNTELIEVTNALAGNYKIVLTAKINDNRVASQPYVVVSNGEVGATISCTDVQEPNDSQETAYGLLPSNGQLSARTCAPGDVDFYRFRADATGVVRVIVTTGDVPLRVSFVGNGLPSAEVAARTTQTLEFVYTGPAPAELVVKVEATGAIAGETRYTITPSFPAAKPARRRIVRR